MTFHFDDGVVQIKKLEVGPYGNNCFIVVSAQSKECVIIDTPAEPEKVLNELEGLKVKVIFITHNHFDHLTGFQIIKESTGASVACHKEDADKLPSPPDIVLSGGEAIPIGVLTMDVIHTPGHTSGSTCYLAGKHLFSGDTLFPHGPGRTSSPDNFRQILVSLTQSLFTLPDDVRVYAGHGDDTVLGREKKEYGAFARKGYASDLCGDVLWMSD